MPKIYRADGPIDKIVQVRLSKAYIGFCEVLTKIHNHGEITVPDVGKLAEILTSRIETDATTVAVISID